MNFGDVLVGVGTVVSFIPGFNWIGLALVVVGGYLSSQEKKKEAKRKARKAYLDSLRDRTTTVRSGVETRKLILGTVRVGGTLVYADTVGEDKEYLDQVIVASGNRLNSVEGIYLGDEYLPMTSFAGGQPISGRYAYSETKDRNESRSLTSLGGGLYSCVLSKTPIESTLRVRELYSESDGTEEYTALGLFLEIESRDDRYVVVRWRSNPDLTGKGLSCTYEYGVGEACLRVQTGLGTDDQPASNWDGVVPGGTPKWTEDHRLLGCGWVRTLMRWSENAYGETGAPGVSLLVTGPVGVYDPRTEASLTYCSNPALLAAWYMTLPVEAGGLGWPTSWVDWSLVAIAADVCDELITVKKLDGEGTEEIRRYECHLELLVDGDRMENLDAIIDAMAGSLAFGGGKYRIFAGAYRAPVLTLTDADVSRGHPISIGPSSQGISRVNVATGTFYDKAQNYVAASAPPVRNADYVTADGGVEESTDLDMQATTDARQADYLLGVALELSRGGTAIECTLLGAGANLTVGDTVWFALKYYEVYEGMTFEIMRHVDHRNGTFTIRAVEMRESSFDLDTERFTPRNPPEQPDTSYLWNVAPVTGLAAESGMALLQLMPGGAISSGLRFTWDQHPDGYLRQSGSIEVRWLDPVSGDWCDAQALPGEATEITLRPVLDGKEYLLAVRGRNGVGARGPWVQLLHTIVGKSEPPAALTSYTTEPDGSKLLITLTAAPEIDIAGYELRSSDVDWGASGQVYRGTGPIARVTPPAPGGALTLYAKAFDTSGNYSAGAALPVTFIAASIPAPSSVTHVFQTTSISGSTVTLDWSDVAIQFGLSGYLISYEVDAVPKVKMVKASTITIAADWVGTRHFQIQAIDLLDNIGEEIDYYVNKAVPGALLALDGYTIDNTVTLGWEPAVAGSLPISHYRIYKNGTLGWRSDAHRIVLSEQDAGTITYGVAPVDTDGREGALSTITLNVAAPPDFVRHGLFVADWSGVKSNAYANPANNALLMPVDSTRTRADIFGARGWTSRADKIADGYTRWVQPAHDGLTAYYEQVWDAGKVLPAMIVHAQAEIQFLAGTAANAVITLTTALDSGFTSGVEVGDWSGPVVVDVPVEISEVRNNFRYWKVRLAVTVPNDPTIVKLLHDDLKVDLFVKVRTEQLAGRTVPGGAHALRSILPVYWNVWEPAMDMPPAGWGMQGDDTENVIELGDGPSDSFGGYPEPLWACIDSGDETGLSVSAMPADLSAKGLLYACWVRQDAAAGQFEIAGATDGSLRTLASAPVTGPLAVLDLPLADTWYLVVVFVHPIGYAGADIGISGVYDVSGAKVADLAEFKANAGLTAADFDAGQAAAGGSMDPTLWMCRPALVPCTAAQAPERIAYLVRCAVEPGIALPLPSDLLATVSIAPGVVGDGTERLAPQVDSDPSTLSHINEFVFDSAEALVEADVTAVIRRY